jgi:hypothetical protein
LTAWEVKNSHRAVVDVFLILKLEQSVNFVHLNPHFTSAGTSSNKFVMSAGSAKDGFWTAHNIALSVLRIFGSNDNFLPETMFKISLMKISSQKASIDHLFKSFNDKIVCSN